MNRRIFLCGLTLGTLSSPLTTEAQQTRVYRIGVLDSVSGPGPAFEAFRQELREYGYIEGQNILIDYRWAGGQRERLPQLAAELVSLRVDVILAPTPPAYRAASKATRTIPIVFAFGGNVVEVGIVASLAHPGGNVTGVSGIAPDLIAKQLELLKHVLPKATRVAVLLHPGNRPRNLGEVESAAGGLGIQLHMVATHNAAEIDAVFATMDSQRVDGVLVLRDALFFAEKARIATLAAKSRLPTMSGYREGAEAGGLIAYGASIPHAYRQAARYVDRILKGASPADLPIEQPTKFELVINLKTAKALGLTIPPSLLLRADQVIE